jgi:hypothetical protein
MYENGYMLEHLVRRGSIIHKQTVIDQVTKHSSQLRHAPKFCSDKQVVLAAVKQNGFFLQEASTLLRNDRDVVLAAVAQAGNALLYAHHSLRSDKEVALVALACDCTALRYVEHDLQSDSQIIEAAVRRGAQCAFFDGDLTKAAFDALCSDQNLMLGVACFPQLLAHANKRLRTKQTIFHGVTTSVDALQYVQPTDLTPTTEVELAQHFVECCKKAGLSRDDCAAKASACKSRNLCIRIVCASYLAFS